MELFYDLKKSPPTHDFINFLVRAEQARISSGSDSIQVRFVHGSRQQSPRDIEYSQERREWRIQNLLMPLAWLLPSVTDVSFGEGEQTLSYLNFKEPQQPVLKAPAAAKSIVSKSLSGMKNPVSITLRQSDFETVRNSRASEWEKVGKWLKKNGYTPVIVPDAEADMLGRHPALPFYTYRPASHNVAMRLALYEHCVCNLMTTGGPMLAALFSDAPLMAFKLIVPGLQCTTEAHMRKSGMAPEHDWGEFKRLYWEDDFAEGIIGRLEAELPRFLGRSNTVVDDVFSLRKTA